MISEKTACTDCSAELKGYYLKNGKCGPCRGLTVVTSQPESERLLGIDKTEFYRLDSLVQDSRRAITRHMGCGEPLNNDRGFELTDTYHAALKAREQESLKIEAAAQKILVNPPVAKVGDLFVYTWGATMRRNEFYEVAAVKGCKVYLCAPESEQEANGYDSGREWITGRCSQSKGVISYAKIVRGKLKKCTGDTFKVDSGSWNTLRPASIGERFSYYGD